MITLYTGPTPDGRAASIMLEEVLLDYVVRPVNIHEDEPYDPAVLAIGPNGQIPVIVDEEGVDRRQSVFGSAAILTYLAEKTGKLLPPHGVRRIETFEWLAWSVSGLAPTLGHWNHFANRAETKTPSAIARFTEEAARLFGVLERRLTETGFLARDYSIADISTYAWTAGMLHSLRAAAPDTLGPTPHVERWMAEIAARPAVQRGMEALKV